MKYITIGTIPNYAKHMNNVKVVHTKETMAGNNITEAVTQKHSNEKNPQKYGAHPQRNIHADSENNNNNETTGSHRRSPRNLPHISRALPIGIHRGKHL